VPLSPRDLATPDAGLAEKEADWQRLLDSAATLRELAGLAKLPQDRWPDTEVVRRLRAVPPVVSETTAERLQRWNSAFEAELSALQQAVSSAGQGSKHAVLTDIGLGSAVYLADRLLAALYGTPPSIALMIWRKEQDQVDEGGRRYGETGAGEDVQLDADRMWWPIARWRVNELKALVFIVNGDVRRVREVYGIDEETTGDRTSLALNVGPPLVTEGEITERLPTLWQKLHAENLESVQGRMRKYLDL
jgi:hypothetical protein